MRQEIHKGLLLHARKVGMGASGANQVPDPANPRLYQTFITFSLDIRPLLAQGKIVPGLGVRCKPRQAAEDHDSWELWGDDDIYSSEDSDALYYEEDDIYSSEDSDASYCEESDDDSFRDPGYSRQHSGRRLFSGSGLLSTTLAQRKRRGGGVHFTTDHVPRTTSTHRKGLVE